jgi:hypothetical protein
MAIWEVETMDVHRESEPDLCSLLRATYPVNDSLTFSFQTRHWASNMKTGLSATLSQAHFSSSTGFPSRPRCSHQPASPSLVPGHGLGCLGVFLLRATTPRKEGEISTGLSLFASGGRL